MSKDVFSKGVLKNHTAIVGMTGSGKTSTAKLLVEQVVEDSARVCVIDPIKSDWWGLTSSASGKRAGLPFTILGGPHGHVPLHRNSGKAIGEIVASGKLPLSIIDMADFGMGDHQKFFIEFAETLVKNNKGVLYLVIEEAHEFAPKEKVGIAGESFAVYWAKKLATAGRSKGIRLIVVSQRTQQLHNSLLSSCRTIIAHQFTYPADQEPILRWFKGNLTKEQLSDVERSLPDLPTGEGWIRSTVDQTFERRKFPRISTYDNSATPEDDADRDEVKTAPVDQDQLRSIIGDAVKEAEANDPDTLKKRIAALTAEKAALERKAQVTVEKPVEVKVADPRMVEQETKAAYHKGFDDGYAKGRESGLAEIVRAFAPVKKMLAEIEAAAANPDVKVPDKDRKVEIVLSYPKTGSSAVSVPTASKGNGTLPVCVASPPISPRTPSPGVSGDGPLSPGERAVLIAAVQYGGVDRDQLSVLTGYKRSSRDTYIQRLSIKRLVTLSGRTVLPTDEASAALGADYQPLPVGIDLQDYWRARLPEGERKTLEVAIAHYPNPVPRETIDESTGYKRSSRDTYIQRLKARRLVEIERDGIRASATLF